MKKAAHSSVQFRHSLVAAALLCAFSGLSSQPLAQTSQPNVNRSGDIRYVKGRILVQPRAGLSEVEFDKKLRVHGGRRVSEIPQINVHVVELPSQANEQAVASVLRRDRHIKFAELDQHVPWSFTPNDPAYTSGWHLQTIGLPNAWDNTAGEGVTIAILDSGVDGSHPDLSQNIVPGFNFIDNNIDTRDVHGHGTKVAGAAAMVGNNLVGGTGVSFKSRIMPVRVADTSGASFSTIAQGITWAADNGARVASESFYRACGSSTIQSAAQYMRSKGGVVTGSGGNSGTLESMTASDSITCVSATDGSDAKASFSSYGGYIDVAAPGVGIYTTTNGGGYAAVSGTSFSAPVTAGIYALMMAANPQLSPSQLDAALFSTAVDSGAGGKDPVYGYGRVDAAAAIAKARGTISADTAAPVVAFATPATNSNLTGLVAVDVKATDNVAVTHVELYADGSQVGTDNIAPFAFSWDSTNAGGQVVLEARAFDAAGNMGTARVTVAAGNDSSPPSVAITNPQPGSLITSATTISAKASDDKQLARLVLTINGKEVAVSSGSTLAYTWNPLESNLKGRWWRKNTATTASGTYTLTATATDGAGNSESASVSVTVP